MERKAITLSMQVPEIVAVMSEGNPGALSVLMQLASIEGGMGVMEILHLDDMNMRGEQIWIAYKDYSSEDLSRFRRDLLARKDGMVQMVNERSSGGLRAVKSGGSRRGPF